MSNANTTEIGPAISLRGAVDHVSRTRISGWAQDPATPASPVALLITADDTLLGRVLAERPREDLRAAGIGDGRHGFELALDGLSARRRHLVTVRREDDGAHLDGSPATLEPIDAFDETFRAYCDSVLSDIARDEDVLERLDFLSRQAEALLSLRAARRGNPRTREMLRQIKWRWTSAADAAAPRVEPLPPRALVIDQWVPVASRDAGSSAILSHMGALRRLGFEVSFAAADMAGDPSGALAAAGIACCHAPWHGSVEEVLRREAGCFDLVYLHRATVAARYLALARFHQPRTRLVYSVADLHHLRLERQAEVEQRPELRGPARRFRAVELRTAAAADAVITHSLHEANLLRQHIPAARVHVIAWTIPARATAVPCARRSGVAFIGHYGHPPNVDAAQWLIDEIMPLVHRTHPAISCLLVGSNLPDILRVTRPGVTAVGHVPDLGEIFDRVRLTVAPMTYGAGIKGKVLESLAAGVPCVCSPSAAEGLDLPAILRAQIAGDAAGLAARVIALHEDAALNEACRQAGLAFVATNLNEERIDGLMRAVAALPAEVA